MYIVLSKRCAMPSSCRGGGSYRNVAVLKVNPTALKAAGRTEPAMISTRARGVEKIVRRWEKVYKGPSSRCEHAQVLAEAQALADKLNRQEGR